MIVRHERWLKIRHLFTEEEKAQLRAVVTGESICPAGVTIDGDKLPPDLLKKISTAQPGDTPPTQETGEYTAYMEALPLSEADIRAIMDKLRTGRLLKPSKPAIQNLPIRRKKP